MAGTDSPQVDAGEIVGLVSSHQKVTSVRSVEFGIYAVTGAISSEELTSITGMHDVRSDAGVGATSVDPYCPTQWALQNDGVSVDPWHLNNDDNSPSNRHNDDHGPSPDHDPDDDHVDFDGHHDSHALARPVTR